MKNVRSNACWPSLLCTFGVTWLLTVVPLPHAHAEPSCSWRFTASEGVITDHNTQLVWQQDLGMDGPRDCDFEPSPGCYSMAEARLYCQNLPLLGGGWRLPTIFELSTIVEDDESMDPAFQEQRGVWSSSEDASGPGFAWALFAAEAYPVENQLGYQVRCVR